MDKATIRKHLEAASRHHRSAYEHQAEKMEPLSGYWTNIETNGVVEGRKMGSERLYLADMRLPEMPRLYLSTQNFGKALLATCPYGNAAGKPFVVQFKDIADSAGVYMTVSHKGTISEKRFKTLGEVQQHGLRKLEFIAPKLSSEEIEERSRDFLRQRIKEGFAAIKAEEQKELQEQLLQAEREAVLEATGFGAW